jgi:transcriptional regulator with XRE-family HTH domain
VVSTVGRNIKHIRLARGLSLDDLAKRANLSKPGLWAIEEGKTSPTFTSIDKVARALGMSASTLVSEGLERESVAK